MRSTPGVTASVRSDPAVDSCETGDWLVHDDGRMRDCTPAWTKENRLATRYHAATTTGVARVRTPHSLCMGLDTTGRTRSPGDVETVTATVGLESLTHLRRQRRFRGRAASTSNHEPDANTQHTMERQPTADNRAARGAVEFRLPVRRLCWSASSDHVVVLCGVKSVCVYACGGARGLQSVGLS
jgi:hypothetical protein